jgi:alcohol dehydrogenase (NADP+)
MHQAQSNQMIIILFPQSTINNPTFTIFLVTFDNSQTKNDFMSTTKAYAAQSASTPLASWFLERREPTAHDVQIDILFCGVCHSDLHAARNEWGNSVYPIVPGHEIVGVVKAVGDHVKKYAVGDKVGVGCFVDSCRECSNCKDGQQQYCLGGATFTYGSPTKDPGGSTYGGYSKEIAVHEDFVLRIANDQPLDAVAPLLCAGITTYSPLRHWKIGKGHKVGVLGLGGLGHMGVKLAVSMGAEVTMLSHTAAKEADAKRLGAHKFVLTSNAEQTKSVAGYFDFILDTVSAAHDYNFYLNMLKTNGHMVCVGAPPPSEPVLAFNLIFQRRSLSGSLIGGIPETQEMLDYCAAQNIVSDVEVIAIKDINEAYERMLKGDVRYRFVIDLATL